MLEKAKNIVADIKADAERKKEEKMQLKKEQKALEARLEAERLAAEEAKIQAEKDSLMRLSEKELLVEAVMALRGLYSRIEALEESYDNLDNTISSLNSELDSVKTEAVRQNLEISTMRLQKH